MLGEVVSFVGGTQLPNDVILALANTITNPIKLHVNGFGSFLLDVIIDNASGCGIVSLNRGGRLWMCQDWSHNLTEDVNRSIVWWQVVSCSWWSCGLGAEEMVASSVGATFGGSEV